MRPMATLKLTKPVLGYEAGTELRDVTLAEARAMECNRCGDCCNGLSPYVLRDEDTGLPRFTWGSNAPADLYAERYGKRLLEPVVMLEDSSELPYQGPIGIGDDFERDADGKKYTSFRCSQWQAGEPSSCALYGKDRDPKALDTIRPRACGDFPVYGLEVDDAIIAGHPFVPPTGALPRCTWYGIRVTGPWKDTPYWRERWERQQRGEEVEDLSIKEAHDGQ